MSPRKRVSDRPKRAPRQAKAALAVRSEVPPARSVPSPVKSGVRDFDADWGALSGRGKNLARYAADQRGVTLRGLWDKFPALWPTG